MTTPFRLVRLHDGAAIGRAWDRLCEALDPPDIAFGPEWRETRPRARDRYYLAWWDLHVAPTQKCGEGDVGLVWTQRPSPTTVAWGFGLWPEYRGAGLGPDVRDAAYAFIFETWPEVYKVESEVYTSNLHSLGALHGRRSRSREEGRQRATVQIRGAFYDRVLYGIDRDEWVAQGG